MKHKSFRQVSDLLANRETYTEAYAEFLQAGNVPSSLKEEIFCLQQHQQQENEEVCALSADHVNSIVCLLACVIPPRMWKINSNTLKPDHNEH